MNSTSADQTDSDLERLPVAFTATAARGAGVPRHRLRALLASGAIVRTDRGIYRRTDAPLGEEDLQTIALRAPDATLCLLTALSHHDLTDQIPTQIDVALPRHRRQPALDLPIAWHRFDAETYDLGREKLDLGGSLSIAMYSPERCLIDAFRLRHLLGEEVAIEALRRWLRRRGATPGALLALARAFPKAEAPLRDTLRVLL
jgi:hypothetical protein